MPEHWWEIVEEGSLPWGWYLCRKLVPSEGSELDHGDIFGHFTHLDLSSMPGISGNDVMYEEVSNFTHLVHLDVCGTGAYSFDVVSEITSLREVVAFNCHSIGDLASLIATPITTLSLSPTREGDAHTIGRITTLESLDIDSGVWSESLEPLNTLTRLDSLNLGEAEGLVRLDGVQALTRLEHLSISSTTLTDIGALRDHPTLRSITLRRCPRLTDLSVLATLPALERVRADTLSGSDPTWQNLANSGLIR